MKEPRNSLIGSTCYLDAELIGYISNLLDGHKHTEIQNHLEHCMRCRLEVVRLRRAMSAAEETATEEERVEIDFAKARIWDKLSTQIKQLVSSEKEIKKVADESSQLLSESELWDNFHNILKSYVQTYLPDKAEHFDRYHFMMESSGLLGNFHPVSYGGSHAEVGFLPSTAEDVLLPVVLGVSSNILYEISVQGFSIQDAIDKNKEEIERVFSQFAKLTQLRTFLDTFVIFLHKIIDGS